MAAMQAIKKIKPELRIHDPGNGEYDFLKCLGRNPLGEVWKVKGADGKARRAQFLPHGENQAALQRLEFIHSHEGLLPLELAQRADGQAILVTDFSPRTLRDRFDECWRQGMPGIPRPELLAALKTVAEILEALYLQYRVRHLPVQPKNIIRSRSLLHGPRVLVAGFGLVELLWLPTQQPLPYLNPRYSAPELYNYHIRAESDQYSLALMYAEMATGVHPVRSLQGGGTEGKLNLGLLSSGEQEVIARALSSLPQERYAGGIELMHALEDAGVRAHAQGRLVEPLRPIIPLPGMAAAGHGGNLDQFHAEPGSLRTRPVQVQ